LADLNINASLDVELPIPIPCPKLPDVIALPDIKLLGGAELKALINLADGYPTDCSMNINILLQLSPVLASMACMLKMLKVIGLLSDFVTAVPDPMKLAKVVPGIVEAIADLTGCIPAFTVPQIILMIKSIIELIIKLLLCVISQIKSLINLQISLDFKLAIGNKALTDSLNCAKENANRAMNTSMLSLEALAPILALVKIVASIVGSDVSIPPLPDLSKLKGDDPEQTIAAIEGAIAELQAASDALDPSGAPAPSPVDGPV